MIVVNFEKEVRAAYNAGFMAGLMCQRGKKTLTFEEWSSSQEMPPVALGEKGPA